MSKAKDRKEAELIIAASEKDSDMFYAVGISTPDPFIWLEADGKTKIYINSLEFGRAQKEATVDEVINDSRFKEESFSARLASILKENGIGKVIVPGTMEIRYVKMLESGNIEIEIKSGTFFEKRKIKSEEEIEKIAKVQEVAERSMAKAIEMIRESKAGEGNKLYYQGEVLTSELVREAMHIELLKGGCGFEPSIVACGEQSADPHQMGKGPLFAGLPIVIDIFPKSYESKYFADITRTVVKGKASSEIKKMYQIVLEAQKKAINEIKPGIKAGTLDVSICEYFEEHGFETVFIGNPKGFIHNTGHGLGMDIHEGPSIRKTSEEILEVGNVFTIEPGLYYPGIGGVRIEDLVVVTADGARNLTRFPKEELEI